MADVGSKIRCVQRLPVRLCRNVEHKGWKMRAWLDGAPACRVQGQ